MGWAVKILLCEAILHRLFPTLTLLVHLAKTVGAFTLKVCSCMLFSVTGAVGLSSILA